MSYPQVEGTSGSWIRREDALRDDDCLVVVSQVCDIVTKPDVEPYVEVARAFWLTDLESISVYDYLTLFQVPLDVYSLPETDGKATSSMSSVSS